MNVGQLIFDIAVGIGLIAWAIYDEKRFDKRFKPFEEEFYRITQSEVEL